MPVSRNIFPYLMSIDQRRHTRFSLEIPAVIITKYGERQESILQQISIGGCFTGWEENIFPGDEFRMEISLPNGNRLPLLCKAVYRFENTGLGVQFVEITEFEQSLIAKIINEKLRAEGLPVHTGSMEHRPAEPVKTRSSVPEERMFRENMLEKIMSGDEIG